MSDNDKRTGELATEVSLRNFTATMLLRIAKRHELEDQIASRIVLAMYPGKTLERAENTTSEEIANRIMARHQ